MDVVVVESPAKAKTINKYLGDDFVVLASYGHVRDLPSSDGSVRPDENFAMSYVTDPKAVKHLKAIAQAASKAERLYLATDPDREGEAISWHVLNALIEDFALDDIHAKRVVFSEITRSAVLNAMAHPRDLDMNLINAQQARRALDYLVGFTLSPVLWRKLPGSRSAGRVQSVALRLICEREIEIEAFTPAEYWSILVQFTTEAGERFEARLHELDGKRAKKFDLKDAISAERVKARILAAAFACTDRETKPTRRHPQPPFTTSTLQQEASRKLGYGARKTMQIAQRLYEGAEFEGEAVGLITYMRTDGVQMANEAVAASRAEIERRYGASFVPEKPRFYRSSAKNAQEAHEAIRPTSFARHPDSLRRVLKPDEQKLYDLIWKRALASQMESARLEQTTLTISSDDGAVVLRASGSVVIFPGFLKLYEEGRDEAPDSDEDGDRRLPPVAPGARLKREGVEARQHFTEPPPRFTEATLVKRLEELGIGRPSTYASILSVLQDRDYVRLEKRRFHPEDRGRLVTAFLTSFFERYVEYGFTAELEAKLDEISAGDLDWKKVLEEFWSNFNAAVKETEGLRVKDVLDAVDAILAPHIFPANPDGADPRACPQCPDGRLSLKLGRYGAFIGCSNYPECRYTRPLGVNGADGGAPEADNGPRELGDDPESGLPVTLRRGPYGFYVQLGAANDDGKPKRASLPPNLPPDRLDLETALGLLALPREVGRHPESGKPIRAGIGRYGPYLQHDGAYCRVPKGESVLTIGLNRAVALIADSRSRKRGALRELGAHPVDGAPVKLMSGRYGPYLAHGRTNAPVPKGVDSDQVTLKQAVELLRARAAKPSGGKKSTGTKTRKLKIGAGTKSRSKAKPAPSEG